MGKNIDSEMYGGKEDLEALRSNKRFVADKGFQGTEGGAAGGSSRAGPVQFEKEADDPFGLDAFLHKAKQASSNKRRTTMDARGVTIGDARTERGGRNTTKKKDWDATALAAISSNAMWPHRLHHKLQCQSIQIGKCQCV